MRRIIFAGVLLVLVAGWWLTLPRRLEDSPFDPRVGVRGAFHVHTDRSDGTGTVAAVAAAASRAGMHFVVFTDHGDGTRRPDPPQYLDGVLCIDAVEISTGDGHVIALGIGQAPYPLGGEARDVLEDIRRLGGFGIAAHPGSVKPELRWTAWDAPFAGMEWLNGDSEWRDESGWTLARGLLSYPARPVESLASVLDRPNEALEHWDRVTQQRHVFALAGADAHARVGLRSAGEPYTDRPAFDFPPYESVFRVFSNVLPGVAMTGDAAADAEAVIGAIRAGRVYSVVDAAGGPAAMTFTAIAGSVSSGTGSDVLLSGPVTLRAEVAGATDTFVTLLRNGSRVGESRASSLEHVVQADAPGAYRVEIFRSGTPGDPPIPWIVSNPIYVGMPAPPVQAPAPLRPNPSSTSIEYDNGPATRWSIETSPASLAALDVAGAGTGTMLALRYGIGGAASEGPFAAFAMVAGPTLARHDRLAFTARADKPMRFSVQLRAPIGAAGKRWQRSVYVDESSREIVVPFDEMRPVGVSDGSRPDLSSVDSVLFVVDTVNTPLGGNGRIWIDDVKYLR